MKGQEAPAHMPQHKRSMGLIYAVNPFGADHQSSEHDSALRAKPGTIFRKRLAELGIHDILDLKDLGPGDMVELVRAATGWDVTLWEVMKVGERRLNLMRAFNAREGLDRSADALPKKFFQPLAGGPTEGVALSEAEMEQAKELYYQMAGWDPASGAPTPGKLAELELDWVLAADH